MRGAWSAPTFATDVVESQYAANIGDLLPSTTDGGLSAVLADYHAELVPPFCLQAVKSFFDTH